MSKDTDKKWIKDNLLRLAIEHKRVCKSSDCNISLMAVRFALEKLEIRLTREEKEICF